jgi:hypothetical protein
MTTTAAFQIKQDFYSSQTECKNSTRNKIQTNPRYRNFNQTHLTAGDESQFEEYRDATNNQVCLPEINLDDNLFNRDSFSVWKSYKDLHSTAVMNTFKYIFFKFKKGIFVKIVNNKLRVFLPFSNANFINEWGDRIKVDTSKHGTLNGFLSKISDMEGRQFNPYYVNSNTSGWYANNCLVRYENPLGEGDTNVSNVKNMLDELCANRELPDMEFFINRRDFPILTKDGTEPYNNLWGSEEKKLVSHSYTQYLPILSMAISDRYADIPIPTHEDWARVQSKEGMWFPKSCKLYSDIFTPWNEKTKQTAVFRGGTTGCGVTIKSNPRLNIARLSSLGQKDENGVPYLDAGITNWNLRPRKIQEEEYLQTIQIRELGFGLVGYMSSEEQSQYKYIINIDGHVTAFRLSLELSMGSVILLVKSHWKIWYSYMLKPYKHYVPVNSDLSNIIEQVKWCKEHDDECRQIALNARNFYETYLQKKGILDYMQKVLVTTKKETGVYLYNYTSPIDLQIRNEYELLNKYIYPNTNKTVADISVIPRMGRSYGLLQGVQWVVNMINKTSSFEDVITEEKNIFKNKLGTVREFRLANFSFAVKTTINHNKSKEHIHEAFIGTKCLNGLSKYIPNFAYVFGMYQKDNSTNVIIEKIQGNTLYEWINKDFNMDDYLLILVQISLAIQVAQNNCCLVHNDLTPWNICLQKIRGEPTNVDYIIGYNQIVRVKTRIIPIIIDYGKSHVVHDNTHYGFINMYKVSTIQDIVTLLVTSIYQIIQKRTLSSNDLHTLINIANFMTNTDYCRQPFKTVSDMKTFLQTASKYSVLISGNKHQLENRTPMDLIKHIQKYKKLSFGVVVNKYTPLMNKGNSRQVFEYILCNTVNEQANTYLDVFRRLKQCTLPQPKNLFLLYYSAQSLNENITSVGNNMLYFLKINNIEPEKYENIFTNTLKFLQEFYESKIENIEGEELVYNIRSMKRLEVAKYTDETFLLPETISNMLKAEKFDDTDLSEYKEIIEYILLNKSIHQLSKKDSEYYINSFAEILGTNMFIMKNNTANYKTLRVASERIYRENSDRIDTALQTQVGNCKDAERYLKVYREILSEFS